MSDVEPGFISEVNVAIVGLGLIGGSLAMALRGKCAAVFGVDSDPETLRLAQEHGIVDALDADPAQVLARAGLVILATPVSAILGLLEALPLLHPGRAVIMDVGSTKRQITLAMQRLPERFDPIGAHPMAGKEKLGLQNACPDLYRGATLALTPLARTSQRARNLAVQVGEAIGAAPLWIDPEDHDRYVASTSHLPFLLAKALALTVPGEAALLAGPGYRSTARLAATPSSMMLDVLLTNRQNVLDTLHQFQSHLRALEESLTAEDPTSLKELLAMGARRNEIILERGKPA